MKPFDWKFIEEDLHEYIIGAYTSKGYKCTNFHESGASVENGVDLLFQIAEDEIAFCVKIKPQKADIIQLNKFVNSSFKNKCYVYIEDPTRPFHDELAKHKEINIMDANSLDKLFKREKVQSYLEKYFYSHDLFREFEKILELCHSVKDCDCVFQKLQPSQIDLLWEWKDRAVSFHKIANTLYKLNDDKFKSVYVDEESKNFFNLIEEVIDCMNYLNEILRRLRIQMEEVKRRNPGFLSYFWRVCKPRSNWFELLGPLDSLPKERISEIFFFFFYNHLPSGAPYSLLTRILENIYEIGRSIEDGIDWTFRDLLTKENG